jgi:hypothetical protein
MAMNGGMAEGPSVVNTAEASMARIVENVNARRQTEEYVTSKLNLKLMAGTKEASVGGSLRMKRNDVIQISLVAFGIMEVGRLEMTPTTLLVMDRIGHQYVQVDYDEVPFLKEAGIDFYTFQSLFWDELFLFGDKGAQPDEKRFKKSLSDGMLKLVNTDSRQMVLTFLADAASALVRQTSVASSKNADEAVLDWQYQAHTRLGKSDFPTQMQILVNVPKKPVQAQISLSNVKANSDWETRTEINTKRYKEVTLEEVMERIMKLAQ